MCFKVSDCAVRPRCQSFLLLEWGNFISQPLCLFSCWCKNSGLSAAFIFSKEHSLIRAPACWEAKVLLTSGLMKRLRSHQIGWTCAVASSLLQSFLRHLLQEAAVEPGESTDWKEYMERHRRVLQTHGWVTWWPVPAQHTEMSYSALFCFHDSLKARNQSRFM